MPANGGSHRGAPEEQAALAYSGRRKRAELISTTGAGVLGAGIGLLFAQWLAAYAVAFLLVGLVCHGWGMYEKHRLDAKLGAAAWWLEWAYRLCWVLLGGLAVYIIWKVL